MAKGLQNTARDTKCGSPLAIFCIPTHFVGDTLSGATPDSNSNTLQPIELILIRLVGHHLG